MTSVNSIATTFLREEGLGFPDRPFTLMDAHHFSDGALWHQPFLQFQKRADGSVYAPVSPSGRMDIPARWSILSELFNATTVINTVEFREAVKASAKKLGYNFPIDPAEVRAAIKFPTFEEMAEETFSDARKTLTADVSQLKPVVADEKGEPFTANGMVIFDWVKVHVYAASGLKSSSFALLAVTTAVTAFENKKITDRDFRRLIKRVLANYPVQEAEGELFKEGMVKIYDHSPTFRTVWESKKEYFLDPSHESGPQGSKAYTDLSAHFLNKCEMILGDTGS